MYEDNRDYYHAVAVIKRGSLTFEDGKPVRTLSDLRGKHACFAGVGTQVSCDWWTGHRNAELSLVQMLWGHTTHIGCGWLQLDVGADKWRRLPGR